MQRMDHIALLINSPITHYVTIASTIYILYRYGTSTFNYFSDQGIGGPSPLPYIGNMWGLWKVNLPKYDVELVQKYGKVFGYFDGTLPNLWTTDADLIKSVFVKDFDHFINRRNFTVTTKVIRKMITIMKDQEWKDVRSSITPAFTSGKIKRMSIMIKESADRLVCKFEKIAKNHGKLDAKIHLNAFTMEVIAKCAFGMTIDHLGEDDDPFMKKAKQVFSPRVNRSPLILMPFLFPKLMSVVGEKLFVSEQFMFFIHVLEDLIKQRADTSVKYHDFIEVATEAIMEHIRNDESPMWGREEVDEIVIAQSVVFLLAGFDTTATTFTNTVFLLARNEDVQKKLYEELTNKIEQFGEVNHDLIVDFPYVDYIVNEALRMYPPVLRVERACNKDVEYNGVLIKRGTLVTVPSFALHYDEQYYPDPHKFNPDRWNPERSIKPNPYAFMPFGLGPRNCVGMRFAMEEIKIALCTLIQNFRFFPVTETPVISRLFPVDSIKYLKINIFAGKNGIRRRLSYSYPTNPCHSWDRGTFVNLLPKLYR